MPFVVLKMRKAPRLWPKNLKQQMHQNRLRKRRSLEGRPWGLVFFKTKHPRAQGKVKGKACDKFVGIELMKNSSKIDKHMIHQDDDVVSCQPMETPGSFS